MACFRVHITTSTTLGLAYGALATCYGPFDWGAALVAAGLTSLGGMLPDLDSDSGVPVRETAGLAGATAPLLLQHRLDAFHLTPDRLLVVLAAAYLCIRFGLRALFARITVHRGMFHSIPAMLCAGLIVFLLFERRDNAERCFLALGVIIGFLSHLVLDEIYAVDLRGLVPRLNHFAGSALKFFSPSWTATLFTWALLAVLSWASWRSVQPGAGKLPWESEVRPTGSVSGSR